MISHWVSFFFNLAGAHPAMGGDGLVWELSPSPMIFGATEPSSLGQAPQPVWTH